MQVEISKYHPINKGFLIGSFTVTLEDLGVTIHDCKLFSKDGKDWVNLPQKEVPQKDGEKPKYYNIVSFSNPDIEKRAKEAMIYKLQGFKNGQIAGATNKVQNQPSSHANSLPF